VSSVSEAIPEAQIALLQGIEGGGSYLGYGPRHLGAETQRNIALACNKVARKRKNLLHISPIMRTPHTATNKGKRVYVQLKDGSEFVDKFLDRKGNYCFFEQQGKIRRRDIKVFTIYKNRTLGEPVVESRPEQ
jgi:hypothetical protein